MSVITPAWFFTFSHAQIYAFAEGACLFVYNICHLGVSKARLLYFFE